MTDILLVEDDPGIGRRLSIHLQAEAYRVHWAQSLGDADRLLAEHRIGLVLLDLGLPDGSGLDFLARIKSCLREPVARDQDFVFGDLVAKIKSRRVEFRGTHIDLNRKEFEILVYLIQRAEQAVTRGDLVQAIDKEAEIFERTVDSHVSHIRSKLRKAEVLEIQIAPIYGIGYRLENA